MLWQTTNSGSPVPGTAPSSARIAPAAANFLNLLNFLNSWGGGVRVVPVRPRAPACPMRSRSCTRGCAKLAIDIARYYPLWYLPHRFTPKCWGEARGNPVRIRGCPAAVSGNERRLKHWLGTPGLGSDG